MAKTQTRSTQDEAQTASVRKMTFPTFEFSPFADMQSRSLGASMRAGEAAFRGMAEYNQHLVDFWSRRVKSDFEAAQRLAGCKTGEAAAEAHAEFVSDMISDYAREAQALFTLGANIARGVAEPIGATAKENVKETEARVAAE